MLVAPRSKTSDQPVFWFVPVCSQTAPPKLTNTDGLLELSTPALMSVAPLPKTSDQPVFWFVPVCSQTAPPNLTNTVSTWAWES